MGIGSIKITYVPPLDRKTRKLVKSICSGLEAIVDIQHHIKIIVKPEPVIIFDKKEAVFGLFSLVKNSDRNKYSRPEIVVAAGKLTTYTLDKEYIENLLDTFCHEFAHYEQWITGKKMQELGITARTKNLKKKLKDLIKI